MSNMSRGSTSSSKTSDHPSNLPLPELLLELPHTPHLRLSGARGGEFVHRKAAFTGKVL